MHTATGVGAQKARQTPTCTCGSTGKWWDVCCGLVQSLCTILMNRNNIKKPAHLLDLIAPLRIVLPPEVRLRGVLPPSGSQDVLNLPALVVGPRVVYRWLVLFGQHAAGTERPKQGGQRFDASLTLCMLCCYTVREQRLAWYFWQNGADACKSEMKEGVMR